MAGVMRSNTGCWTCRVRRKKCDEKGLPCVTCSSLGLLCYGYGPRPAWFDGGRQEKAQAAAFKAIVRHTSLAKRRDRWQENGLANLNADKGASGTKRSTRPGSFELSITAGALESTPNAQVPMQLFESFEELPLEPFELDDDLNLCLTHSDNHDTASDYSAAVGNALPTSSVTNDAQFDVFSDDQHYGVSIIARACEARPGSLPTPKLPDPESCCHTGMQDLPTPATPSGSTPKPLPTPILSGPERAALQYYTEVVFPSWLCFLPVEVARDECKRTIEASHQLRSALLQHFVSLSTRLQEAELGRFGLGTTEPTLSGTFAKRLQFPITVLSGDETDESSLLHLLLAQVSQGGKDWPGLLERLSCATSVSNSHDPPSHIGRAVLSYIEVLASTLTGAELQFARRHITTHDRQAAVGYVTGVESWLLDGLMRIIQLRRWKKEQQSKGSLSMVELVTRSLVIEQDIQKRRQESPQHGNDNDHARSAFMHVYASAAAVFLQCTASGARPQIAEIQKEVSNTIQALRSLPQASLLKRLAWPVCIAASMTVEPSQQTFFRCLFQRVVEAWGPEEIISQALETAFECWRLQGSAARGETYDWIDAMKSRGRLLLLF